MKNDSDFLTKTIEGKTIVWFKNSNEYLILENSTAETLKRLNNGDAINEIGLALSTKLTVPLDKTIDFIQDLKNRIYIPKTTRKEQTSINFKEIKEPIDAAFVKFYKVNNIIFKVTFSNELELSYVHPKFGHLEVEATENFKHKFTVFTNNDFIFLLVDNSFINAWSKDDIHFFQGKFSMELIQKIHEKDEKDWLGVFHASAVSNSEKAILFLGDSGNGKSTSLALLQASGFTCLADDFVPMDSKKQEVYSFPAAISIKKNSLETLLPIYPELKSSAEFNFKRLNKVVRYLKPNNDDYFAHLPCNDLVFIKYKKEAKLICKKIAKIDAFEQLVPDSWLSPLPENAKLFLDWFNKLDCYQITYSNNNEMTEAVSKIFNNEV